MHKKKRCSTQLLTIPRVPASPYAVAAPMANSPLFFKTFFMMPCGMEYLLGWFRSAVLILSPSAPCARILTGRTV